jgi:acid phosphatase class B
MMKKFNIRNIIILVAALAVLHFGIGFIVSPMVSPFVVQAINKTAGTKISIGKVNVWPLTLSLGLKDLKVFDPQKEDERILSARDVSVRVSVLGLLSKRLSVSAVSMNDVQVTLAGEPDGTFNIEKLAPSKAAGETKSPAGLLGMLKGKQDWFSKGYDFLKKRFSKDSRTRKEEKASAAKKITRDVTRIPKGRVVHFKTGAGMYLVEVRGLVLNNLSVKLKSKDGAEIEIDKAVLKAGNVGLDPELGFRLGELLLAGGVVNQGVAAGRVELRYAATSTANRETAEITADLKDVNLDAARFIYEDSLPVEVVKGTLNLTSMTRIVNGALESKNTLSLSNHELKAKGLAVPSSADFIPVPMICEGLNAQNPVKLNFNISGTVEKPEFSGLMKSLSDLIKPNLKNLVPSDKADVANVVGSLSSLFGQKK